MRGAPVLDTILRFASVAQLVEQVTLNHLVLGSSPSRGITPVSEAKPQTRCPFRQEELGIERTGGCPQNPSVHPEENMETALEEGGLQIWGDVKFRADAVLQGKIRGDVHGLKKIIVSHDAVVTGSVEGSDVRVEGEVRGGVTAAGRVWLGPKAKVRVRCGGRALRIEPGAQFRGEIRVG